MNMKLNFRWQQKQSEFARGESLYLNKIRIGGYTWNVAKHRGETTPDISWVGSLSLPGLEKERVYSDNPGITKMSMERMVTDWFREALKKETP